MPIVSTRETPFSFWEKRHAEPTIKKCHWLEVIGWVAAVVLIIFACCAFSLTDAFLKTQYAHPFGFCCLGLAGAIIVTELVYKAAIFCKPAQPSHTSLRRQ